MGLDVCATFHMGISPSELRALTASIVERGAPAYLMAVAGNADPMLGYMTTSFREHPELRRRNARDMTTAMRSRLTSLQTLDAGERQSQNGAARIYAAYGRAGGERKSLAALEAEGVQRLACLQDSGFDVAAPDRAWSEARLSRIYTHARRALYAAVADSVIRDATTGAVRVRTAAGNRDEYLARPQAGERLHVSELQAVRSLYAGEAPDVQVVVSDGLNADALNELLRLVLPALRRELSVHGFRVGDHDIVVTNGRVRVGYEIGGLVNALIVVHLIGERPGTGLNTLSAYVTYGHDPAGRPRWHRGLDHSYTNAICGIHPRGTAPATAVPEIVRLAARMRAQRRSGVALAAAG
jgi:ethanolamine ammonia-lyase large subunit